MKTFYRIRPGNIIYSMIVTSVVWLFIGIMATLWFPMATINAHEEYMEQPVVMVTFNYFETNRNGMYTISSENMSLRECIERSNLQSVTDVTEGGSIHVRARTCRMNPSL